MKMEKIIKKNSATSKGKKSGKIRHRKIQAFRVYILANTHIRTQAYRLVNLLHTLLSGLCLLYFVFSFHFTKHTTLHGILFPLPSGWLCLFHSLYLLFHSTSCFFFRLLPFMPKYFIFRGAIPLCTYVCAHNGV